MSRQKAGLRKEHELASEIYQTTGGSIIPLRAGWSGNSGVPAPDLLIPYKGSLRAIEVKTSGQKRMVVERDDLQDVIDWSMDMNEIHTFPYLSVKFTYYEIQTFRLERPWDMDETLNILAEKSPFDARITRGSNISFGHPTHYDSEVKSASESPGDAAAMLRDLRNDEFANVDSAEMDTVSVYDVLQQSPDYWDDFGD